MEGDLSACQHLSLQDHYIEFQCIDKSRYCHSIWEAPASDMIMAATPRYSQAPGSNVKSPSSRAKATKIGGLLSRSEGLQRLQRVEAIGHY